MASPAIPLSSEGLYPQPTRAPRGVRNLAMGILVQAVRDVVSKSSSNLEWKQWQQDALQWFHSNKRSPGSFLWVAGILDVAPNQVRSWLQTLLSSEKKDQIQMASRLIHFRVTR